MILLLGGTSDARLCREVLDQKGIPYLESTATAYDPGRHAEPEGRRSGAGRMQGPLDHASLRRVIDGRNVRLVIDATHPFAASISRTAMEVCAAAGCTYLRYERRPVPLPDHPLVRSVPSAGHAAGLADRGDGNVLLTTGSRSLQVFADMIHPDRLFARVLPRTESIRECERCRLLPSHIVAMQGPFDRELNGYLIRKFSAEWMVSKQSGAEGGLREKIESCLEHGVQLLVIEPPALEYPGVVHDAGELSLKLTGIFKE